MKYPDFPATHPLSSVQGLIPTPSLQTVALFPKHPSDATNNNTFSSEQSDGGEVGDSGTWPGFHRSFMPSPKSMNPNSVARSSDECSTQGVQSEEKTDYNKIKWKLTGLENTPACRRLVERAFAPCELPSLIETVFSSKGDCDEASNLLRVDAQTFIDVIDEARSTFICHRESVD